MQNKNLLKNKVLFVELNEFNPELLDSYAQKYNYKNLQKLLSLYSTETYTEDTYESDYLEPWVQWVSVHTGKPSSKHQIKHLGDAPDKGDQQIWEKLSDEGVSSGIWGAMNASKGSAKNCLFFLPDPWTASENEHPLELKPLLETLRYLSKNYLNTSYLKIGHKVANLALFLGSHKILGVLRKEIVNLKKHALLFKKEAFVYISLFDYISTLTFLSMSKKYQPDFSLIFLNSLAHLQHHHWDKEDGKANLRFKYGLDYLDRSLGAIFDSLNPNDTLICANALSQKNTAQERPWILYRQTDQAKFLKTVGLKFEKVEAHMTHDAHIFFKTQEDAKRANNLLSSASVNGSKLFEVESYQENPCKLFYKIIFTDEIPTNSLLQINKTSYPFFELFKPVVKRTGRHIQTASLLCNKDLFPKKIFNHEIFDCLYQASEILKENQALK